MPVRHVRLFVVLTVFLRLSVSAAYLTNVPQTLVQPDGRALHCFASGDEFTNWLHDANGYTILRDSDTGVYVYAVPENGTLKPTNLIPGRDDPQTAGLEKRALPSVSYRTDRRSAFLRNMQPAMKRSAAPKQGTVNNIVVFIRFSDEDEFGETISTYDDVFNAGARSMADYFNEASYGLFGVHSTFYPRPSGGMVVTYQDVHPRNHYRVYHATANPDGYQGDEERAVREQELIKNAVAAVEPQIPDALEVDLDSDGYVDNVCVIVSGSPEGWSELLWPHQWALYMRTALIHGKRVWTFNFQLQTSVDSGVLCHEMFHSVGAPDLYHYSHDGLSPAGPWDLMASTGVLPQHMGAYMKFKYGDWIDAAPEIAAPGTYTLNPLTASSNQCFKIRSPLTAGEYFVLEYRSRSSSDYESVLPGSGLLVYRIRPDLDGNSNGPPDEVYIYRPGGAPTEDGNVYNAHFSSDVFRTQINDYTDPSGFLSDGGPGGLNLYNIGPAGPRISFTVGEGAYPSEPPRNLAAEITGARDVLLTWDDPVRDLNGATVSLDRIHVFRNGFEIGESGAGAESFLDPDLAEGYYVYRVTATDVRGIESGPSDPASVLVGETDVVIWAHPETARPDWSMKAEARGLTVPAVESMIRTAAGVESAQAIQTALETHGKSSVLVSDITSVDLSGVEAVFILAGHFPNNHVIAANSGEAAVIIDYLERGGNVYMEGGDVWAWDPSEGGHDFGPLFHIAGLDDGSDDLGTVLGEGFASGLDFTYSGPNNYMDRLAPLGSAEAVHVNQNPAYTCGVAYDSGSWKTVGVSFQFGGLDDLSAGAFTKADLMAAYLDFFGLGSPEYPGLLGDVNADGAVNSTDALIVVSCDVGMDVSAYCPMPCGDVNADGAVNSTDALIILSHNVGMDVPYALGEPGCPDNGASCAGCNP